MAVILFLVLIFFGSLNDISDGCHVGFYGESCSKKCPNFCHDNECNVTTGKCLSCLKGYYSNNTKDCVPCPEHCTACSSYTFCFACVRGFKGEVCKDMCTNCRPDTSCDKNTGYCFENCSEGLSGELCNIPCDSKCKSCDRHNTSQCISCADDENGKSCKEECFNKCLRNTCNESYGSCAEECSSGYTTDKTCNRTCLTFCKDRVCSYSCKELVPPDKEDSSTSKANIGLIVGLVIGSIVIICVCGIVYIKVRRSYTKGRSCWVTFGDRNRNPAINDDELLPLEEKRRTETRDLPSAKKLTILQMKKFFIEIEQKYNEMKICVAENKVTVEADTLDIEKAFNEIYTECDKIEHVEYKHSKSREWVRFCQREHTIDYIKSKHEQKQLIGTWDINGTELTGFVFGKGNSENFKTILLESILEISEPADKSLLCSEWWGEFLIDIGRIFQEKVDIFTKRQQDVVIICTDDVEQQVKQLFEEFLNGTTDAYNCDPGVCKFVSKYWKQAYFGDMREIGVMVKTEANRFIIRGLSDKLRQAKQSLETKLKAIYKNQHVLTQTGIVTVLEDAKHTGIISAMEEEYRCVIKLPKMCDKSPLGLLRGYEIIDSEIIEENQHDSSTFASPKYFQTKRHNIIIQFIHGDIGQQKADIIVVGAASNHELRSGSAFLSSLKKGGPQLKTNYNRLYPNGIRDGEVAVIDSGEFSCDNIYLTSLPPWKEATCNGGKVLRKFLRECLRLADKYAKKTIAFSSMVTGVDLGYPKDLAVSIMYGAFVEFDSSYSKTSLKEINIVMDNEDDLTIKAFEDHQHKRIYGAYSVGSLSTDFAGGKIKIELVTGDLFTQKIDAILGIVSSDMKLNESAIFQFLVQNGCISLQDENIQKYNELNVGKVLDIPGKQLSCKSVFLTVLPPYTESTSAEKLITTLQIAFRLADSKNYKSIAIPALETFNQTTKTSKCMYDVAINWANKNPNASLEVVRFVLNSKDKEVQRIYRKCHLNIRGREARNKRIFIEDETILFKPVEDLKYMMVKDGCAIGSIQLQIQVGNVLNNAVIGIFDTEERVLEKEEVISSSDGLGQKYVFHVRFQDSLAASRCKVVECLEEASKNSLKCVTFPFLRSETGPNMFPVDGIGECLFAALDDFTSQNPMASVTNVILAVDDSNAGCVPVIIAGLQNKTTAVNCQLGISKLFKSQIGSVDEANQLKETFVSVYSDATDNIDRCIRALDDRIGLEFSRKEVDVDREFILSLNKQEINSIIYSDILVDVKFDEQKPKFIIVGPLRNTLAAVTYIYNKIRHYKMEQNSTNSAMELYDQTKWHWLSEKHVPSEMEVPYDMMTNYIVETAYKAGKQTVELQSKDGKIYRIDFEKLVEYPAINIIDTVMVIRRDILILKGALNKLSKWWKTMSNTENVKRVTLDDGQEYKNIEKRFLECKRNSQYASKVKCSQSLQVVEIERIQNKTLYQQYKAMKKMMNVQKSGCKQKERHLWHETAEENIHLIINNGFNRSYCRNHELKFGQGVYFAADASYSDQSCLAGNNPGTKRYMFLAKVLTGDVIKGEPSMRVLPPIKSAQPTIIYDSAVDDVNTPSLYVIFHEKKSYPKYLITYVSK